MTSPSAAWPEWEEEWSVADLTSGKPQEDEASEQKALPSGTFESSAVNSGAEQTPPLTAAREDKGETGERPVEEQGHHGPDEPLPPSQPTDYRAVGVAVLLSCALLASLAYAWIERRSAATLASEQAQMTASLDQMKSQLAGLAARINALSHPPSEAPAANTAPQSPRRTALIIHKLRAARAVEDRQLTSLQKEVAAQQQRLDSTQQNLDATQQNLSKAQSELAQNLSSAQDELGGSIARTHNELVALERKGERNYFEFDLDKSKHFERVGPLSISLRKANVKHGYFNMEMIVNDVTVDKKHVNLDEPVIIYPSGSSAPLELVANQIDKNNIHGYISEPKFNQAPASLRAANTALAGAAVAANSLQAESAANPANESPNDSAGAASAAGGSNPQLQRRAVPQR